MFILLALALNVAEVHHLRLVATHCWVRNHVSDYFKLCTVLLISNLKNIMVSFLAFTRVHHFKCQCKCHSIWQSICQKIEISRASLARDFYTGFLGHFYVLVGSSRVFLVISRASLEISKCFAWISRDFQIFSSDSRDFMCFSTAFQSLSWDFSAFRDRAFLGRAFL